jgi:serine phosphatase RsbU (regulator of sigma subunit)
LLLVAGAWMARGVLPAWSLDDLASREDLENRYRQLVEQAGVAQVPDEQPALTLVSREGVYDPSAREPVYTSGRGDAPVLVRAVENAGWGDTREAELVIGFTPAGEPRSFAWMSRSLSAILSDFAPGTEVDEDTRKLAELLVPSGRTLGREAEVRSSLGTLTALYPLDGEPPAHVEIYEPLGAQWFGFLRSGTPEASDRGEELIRKLVPGLGWLLVFLAVAGLFLTFLGRRRIDVLNGSLLATIVFCLLFFSSLFRHRELYAVVGSFVAALGPSIWVLFLWSTGESWLRSSEPDFSSSLDALRVGRLGPRGGRALLGGLGIGAGLAGIWLLMLWGVEQTETLGRTGLSVPLPVFSALGDPISDGVLLASAVLLVAVIALRWLPRRWALPLAAVVAGALTRPVPVAPPVLAVAAGAVIVAGLLFALRRFELTGLLTAATALFTLPSMLVAARWIDWMPGSFAFTAGLVLAAGGAGWVGLRREGEEEARGMGAPAFVRRLEDEKRLHHEMGLLARMQLGLLPESVPRMDGWQISARSVLATEVGGDLYDFVWDREGRLWIAAGDVSGHGYSCAIVHAMTKAALASLVAPDRTPGQVLAEVDRVLRTVRYRRAFTSLVLLRLDPGTGDGVLANAGHPYPLLFSDGEVRDIELPGLPLGQGPSRSYPDRPFVLEVGAVLVLCSDGLFEATDRDVKAYGFDRPRQLLSKAARWPSNEVLEMLLADWRRHRGPVSAADDTTVVVIKRLGPGEGLR